MIQLSKHEAEIRLLRQPLCGVRSGLLQALKTLLGLCDAWFKFSFVQQSRLKGIDQTADAPLRDGHLLIDLRRAWP